MDYIEDDDGRSPRLRPEDNSEAEKMPIMRYTWEPSATNAKQQAPNLVGMTLLLLASLSANIVFVSLWLLQPQDLDAICAKHTSATC